MLLFVIRNLKPFTHTHTHMLALAFSGCSCLGSRRSGGGSHLPPARQEQPGSPVSADPGRLHKQAPQHQPGLALAGCGCWPSMVDFRTLPSLRLGVLLHPAGTKCQKSETQHKMRCFAAELLNAEAAAQTLPASLHTPFHVKSSPVTSERSWLLQLFLRHLR